MLSVNVGGCGAQVKTGAGNFLNIWGIGRTKAEAFYSVLATPSRKSNSCTTFLTLLDSSFYILFLRWATLQFRMVSWFDFNPVEQARQYRDRNDPFPKFISPGILKYSTGYYCRSFWSFNSRPWFMLTQLCSMDVSQISQCFIVYLCMHYKL